MQKIKAIFTKAFKSRTLLAAHAISILGFLQVNQQLFTNILEPEQYGWFVFGIGIVMAWLRADTTSALEDK